MTTAVPKYKVLDDSQNKDFKNQCFKMKQYYDEQTNAELIQRTILPLAVPTVGGFCIGNCVGGPGTGLIGAGIGLLSGAAYTLHTNYYEYQKWLKIHIESGVIGEFKELYINHPQISQFLDPITVNLINEPVKSPFGHIYDKSTLQKLANDNLDEPGVIKCPYRNGNFTMAEVQAVPDFFPRMKTAFKAILSEEVNKPFSPEVKKGLEALITDLEKQVVNYVARESDKLTDQLRYGNITLQQYTKRINDLTNSIN